MNGYCITCKFCDHSEGHVCTLGRLPIDDPYSDSCASYEAQKEQPYIIGVDLAPEPKEDYRLCPDCQHSVDYDDMVWLNGKCTCPSCYIKRRAQMDAQKEDNHAE